MPDGKLVYNDVTSHLLLEEIRHKTRDSLHHCKAHYVQKDGKQQRGHLKQRDLGKDNQRYISKERSKSRGCYKNIQYHYYDKYGHIKKDCCI